MLIAQCSDAHLGFQSFNGARSKVRKGDFFRVFAAAIDEMIDRNTEVAIFPGDLYDTPDPDNETQAFVIKHIRKLRDADVEVIVVSGQHDTPKSRRTHPFEVLEESVGDDYCTIVYQERQVVRSEYGNERIVAVPWEYKTPVDWSSISSGDILVIHLPNKQWYTDPGERCFDPDEFDNRWGYILLGDYHERREVFPNALYSGGLERTTFGQQDTRCGLLFWETDEASLEAWDSPARDMVTIDYELKDSTDTDEINKILQRREQDIVRLRLSGKHQMLDVSKINWHPLLKKEFIKEEDADPIFSGISTSGLEESWDKYSEVYDIGDEVNKLGKRFLRDV